MPLPKPWIVSTTEAATEGGQAHLFPVHRPGDDVTYALKRLKNSDDPARLERFRREVETVRDLSESGLDIVPRIIAVGLDERPPYFVMPWYREGSLQVAVDQERYKSDLLAGLAVATKVARSISLMHEFGVAHRDLKPANIFIVDNNPILADFGLCLSVEGEAPRLTSGGEAVGSRLYIAPENESGVNEEQDQRPADLYAFGKIVWALLAGTEPFARESYREPKWRLGRTTGEPKLDKLDGLFDLTVVADVRVRANTTWAEVIGELQAVEAALGGTAEEAIAPPERTVDIARAYAQRSDVVERRASNQLFASSANWLQMSLMPAFHEGLKTIETALAEIQKASNGEIIFWLTDESLGMDLANYFAEFLPRGGVITPRDIVRNGHHWGANSSAGTPRLVMPNWFRGTEADVVIASMPILHWPHEYGLPERVLHQYAGKLGPIIALREASVDGARAFGRQRAELFLKLATRYVEMVVEDKDMIFGDPKEWDLTS